MNYWLVTDYGLDTGEWWYNNFKRFVFLEKHIGPPDCTTMDFKFYCFHGRVELIHTDTDRFTAHKRNFYDRNWIPLPIRLVWPSDKVVERPKELAQMIEIAERLSADLLFARIDLYLSEGKVIFGEITLSPGNAGEVFEPNEFDKKLGDLLDLGL